MCLILFAQRVRDDYPLILLANRDEFHARPTAVSAFRDDAPDILAGHDLARGGTWSGITRQGRVAAITNYREAGGRQPSLQSRGHLVRDYLCSEDKAMNYLRGCAARAADFQGYNLLAGTTQQLCYYSNRLPDNTPVTVADGLHGLSNHLLDTPWPKVQRGLKKLADILSEPVLPAPDQLLDLMADHTPTADADLPDSGVSLDWERLLSPMFIVSPDYGTRSTTLLLVDYRGIMHWYERIFNAEGTMTQLVTQTVM